jgi:hypothetical protein
MRLVNSAIIGDVSGEIRPKMDVCPACGEAVEPAELQQPAGIGGGTYCPKCGERVYVSSPYPKLIAVLSLLLAVGILLLMRVTSVIWFAAGTLDGDRRAIELGECKATEGLVVGLTLVPQYADRDRFAEQQSLMGIRTPVHAGHVTS